MYCVRKFSTFKNDIFGKFSAPWKYFLSENGPIELFRKSLNRFNGEKDYLVLADDTTVTY